MEVDGEKHEDARDMMVVVRWVGRGNNGPQIEERRYSWRDMIFWKVMQNKSDGLVTLLSLDPRLRDAKLRDSRLRGISQ